MGFGPDRSSENRENPTQNGRGFSRSNFSCAFILVDEEESALEVEYFERG